MAESPIPIAEIDHGPSKFDQFLDQHTSKLVIGAILIALGVIGYVIYSGLARAKAEEAGASVIAAENASDYQDVIKSWPKTKSAESAMLLLAGVQWEESQADSIQTLRDFLSNHPEHPAAATAKVSLGLRLAEQDKKDEAITLLTEVANDANASFIAPLACITLGDLAKVSGNTNQAKTWYEKATEDPAEQGNTYLDTAQARIALVNALPPTKIQPAPPAPATPPTPNAPTPTIPTPPTPGAATSTPPTPPVPPVLPPLVEPDTPETDPKKNVEENPTQSPEGGSAQ